MDENFDIQKELEGLSPELARLRKRENQPFSTPENYFEQMPAEMQDYVQGKVRKRKALWLRSGLWEWAPAAAILFLVAGLSFYFLTRPETKELASKPVIENARASELADEEVLLEELDEDFLVEALAMAEPAKAPKTGVEAQEGQEVKEEIEEYILDNFDESLFTEEL